MTAPTPPPAESPTDERPRLLWRWALVLGVAVAIILPGPPAGILPQHWRLLAIFLACIVGSIVRPAPMGAVILVGVAAVAITGTMSFADALKGYADPIVWMVLCAFMIARAVTTTGLGRRIAFHFIRRLGRRSLGVGYALVATDTVLASVIPSNSARAGGILFPIARSVAEAFGSHPGPTRRRLGSFLMAAVYQADVVACAIFLTGQASNPIIAKFALDVTGIELTYARWLIGAIVPGIAALLLVVYLIYWIVRPEVTDTPEAVAMAREALDRMGPMSAQERVTATVFALIGMLWMTGSWHPISAPVVALAGICLLILTQVLTWDEILGERAAWDVFVWYGGLFGMAGALGASGVTTVFAEWSATLTVGWSWTIALPILFLIYFYSHYAFASITAHVTAMFVPFLTVVIAAGAPPLLAVLALAYGSNLTASLTHYGTTTAPIYFGARYNTQREWWGIGFAASLVTCGVWAILGLAWWKLLGWW
jgi:DASS family divalent anion:Na+ symporter